MFECVPPVRFFPVLYARALDRALTPAGRISSFCLSLTFSHRPLSSTSSGKKHPTIDCVLLPFACPQHNPILTAGTHKHSGSRAPETPTHRLKGPHTRPRATAIIKPGWRSPTAERTPTARTISRSQQKIRRAK